MTVRATASEGRTISLVQARNYLLRRPGGLYPHGGPPIDPSTLVRQIGLLQVDPVSVVAANHHLVARARMPMYQPDHLDAALYQERVLVENFHAIHAILPMEDWRYYDRRLGPPTRMEQAHPEVIRAAHDRVIAAIHARGPLAARHFDSEDDRIIMEYGWGTTRQSQVALQNLLRRGFLMVHHREGTQRFYDLTERFLPPKIDTTPVTDAERERHFAQRELTYAGLAMGARRLKPAIAAGDTLPITVEGVRGTFFIAAHAAEQAETATPIAEEERKAVILAPLDPFVWDRKRLAALWGFDYTWEVYVPQEKRQYGPYTLPILWGDRFVARLDPSLDRKRRVLMIRNLWFEADASKDPQLYTDLAAEIARFAAFHGDVAVALGAVTPLMRDKALRKALARATTVVAYDPLPKVAKLSKRQKDKLRNAEDAERAESAEKD